MSPDAAERRERVLAALVAAGPAGVSGEALAEELACSRAAVHRHVEALRRDGLEVASAHDGYRLAEGADPVVPLLVVPRLRAPLAGPVTWLSETGSTNDELISLAREGAPEGTVVGRRPPERRAWPARAHLAGRARACAAGLGAAAARVAPVNAGLLPIVVAVGVADALAAREPAGDVRIIWPNDILVGGRKVAGILCEMSADQDRVAWAVAGIGINVRSAPDLDDARWTPGALSDRGDPPARADLLVSLLGHLGRRYTEWVDRRPGGHPRRLRGARRPRRAPGHGQPPRRGGRRLLRGHRRPRAAARAHRGRRAPARRRRGGAGLPLTRLRPRP